MPQEPDNTKLGFYCSTAVHACVAIAVVVSIFAKDIFYQEPEPPTVFEMVEPAAEMPQQQDTPQPQETPEITQPQVEDIKPLEVSEPEPTPPEPTPPEPEPTPEPEPKPTPKPEPKLKPKPKKVSYEDFIKNNPDKRKPKNKPRPTRKSNVKVDKITSTATNTSNIANIKIKGGTSAAVRNQLAAYTQYINSMAKRNWVAPQGVQEGLATTIEFHVSKRGVVSKVRVLKSSGDVAFDKSVVAAFTSISLVPPPDGSDHSVNLIFVSE